MENKEYKGLLEELKELKERIVYVMTHRKEIIEQYGSMDNFYLGNLKKNLSKDFPLIAKYFKLRKEANDRYHGDIDQFYKDMFLHTKKKAIETYGDITTAIISYPADSIFQVERENDVKRVNEALGYYDEVNALPVFYDYFKLCNKYTQYFNSFKLNKDVRVNFSKEEIIFYARKIIEDIDPSLVEDFDTFTKSNSIKFIKSIKTKSSFFRTHSKFSKGRHINSYFIYIVNDKPLDAIVTLVHEFLHFTNNYSDSRDMKRERKFIHNKYTEFISIFFENYAINYLKERFSLDGNITNYSRHNDNKEVVEKDLFYYLPFAVYKEYGEYTFDTFKQFIDTYNVPILPTLINFEKTLSYFKKKFCFIIKKRNLGEYSIDDEKAKERYRSNIYKDFALRRNHLLGTLLYYKVKNKVSKRDMIQFSKLLKKGTIEDIKNLGIYDFLEYEHKSLFTDDTPLREMDKDLIENKGKSL